MSLYCRVEHCGYDKLQDKMISDCIVVGLQDTTLSETPVRVGTNTRISDCKVWQAELIEKRQPVVQGEGPHIESLISKKQTYTSRRVIEPSRLPTRNMPDKRQEAQANTRCGKIPIHNP